MDGHGPKSTKQSDGRNSEPPPERTVYFLDENFGNKTVAEALAAAGMRVETHAAHFQSGAKDHDWIPAVVARGWVILTMDSKFRYRPNEREALQNSGGVVFVFTGGEMRGAEAAKIIVGAEPEMNRILRHTDPPFVATITRSGTVTVRWPTRENK